MTTAARPLAEVVALGDDLLEGVRAFAVGVQRAGEGRLEAGQVEPALAVINAVRVAPGLLREPAVVLQGHVDPDGLGGPVLLAEGLLPRAADDRREQGGLRAVHVPHELREAVFVVEGVGLAGAFVLDVRLQAGVEERGVLQAAVEGLVIERRVAEDFRVGLERDLGAGGLRGA